MTHPFADAPHDPAALTRHIETRYHDRLRQDLPGLIDLARRVEHVHAADVRAPARLADVLEQLWSDMDMHMRKEEQVLFPAIRRGAMAGIEAPLAILREDHAAHDRDMAHIRALTRDLTLPPHACRSWTALYDGLRAFLQDMADHIGIENDLLFPLVSPLVAAGKSAAPTAAAMPSLHRGCACQNHG